MSLLTIALRASRVTGHVIAAGLHPVRTARSGVEVARDLLTPAVSDAATPATATATPQESAAPYDLAGQPIEVDDSAEVTPLPRAPHIPPEIAAELERDYGDEIPGFSSGE